MGIFKRLGIYCVNFRKHYDDALGETTTATEMQGETLVPSETRLFFRVFFSPCIYDDVRDEMNLVTAQQASKV